MGSTSKPYGSSPRVRWTAAESRTRPDMHGFDALYEMLAMAILLDLISAPRRTDGSIEGRRKASRRNCAATPPIRPPARYRHDVAHAKLVVKPPAYRPDLSPYEHHED
jgi:hypothetical protein